MHARGRIVELALFTLNKKTVIKQSSQNQKDMLYMFLVCLRKDKNIIKINKEEIVQYISKDIIDQCLEHGGSIRKSKRHCSILEVSKLGRYPCLLERGKSRSGVVISFSQW